MSDADVSHDDSGGATEHEVNTSRRYFLIGATSVAAGVGAVGAAVPFVQYWNPSAKAKALGAPVRIDISKLAPGEMLSPIQSWRGKPIFVIYRDAEAVSRLESNIGHLADPGSARPMQPDYAANPTRSTRPEIGIYIGICTHLGCSPKLVVADNYADAPDGGFFCPCHGSRFDLAGRVGTGFPAPDNLEVPPHSFIDDNTIIIGEEGSA
ncbi:MAG: ubiquinol-cytochrome c reductase iron-sulfur subunit [Pseudomonadota bacterium]